MMLPASPEDPPPPPLLVAPRPPFCVPAPAPLVPAEVPVPALAPLEELGGALRKASSLHESAQLAASTKQTKAE
jgi:hypothetical protein